MKNAPTPLSLTLWLCAVVLSMASGVVRADEYTEVSALVRAGKLPDALTKADQYLVAQPRDPQMRFLKGVIQRDSGKTSEAIATFTRLTEDYPELPEPYNNLAVMYAGQSQFDKARAALEMAIRTNPSYATAHENLGDIYAKLASQAYNKALQLDNTNQTLVAPKLALIREIFSTSPNVPRAATTAKVPAAPSAGNTSTSTVTAPPPAAAVATPAPTPTPAPVVPVAPAAAAQVQQDADKGVAAKEVEAAVAGWAKAWSSRDMKTYLAAYGKEFDPPGSKSRKAWEEERTQRIVGKATISVRVEKLAVTVTGSDAVANFRQDYKAGGLAVSSNKQLTFSKVGERWLIVKESVGN